MNTKLIELQESPTVNLLINPDRISHIRPKYKIQSNDRHNNGKKPELVGSYVYFGNTEHYIVVVEYPNEIWQKIREVNGAFITDLLNSVKKWF